MEIKEFAEKFIRAQQEAHDEAQYEALGSMMCPDVVYHDLAHGQDRVGWQAHKQHLIDLKKATSYSRHEWRWIIGEGQYFALSYKATDRFTVPLRSTQIPAGTQVSADCLFLFRVRDGKVAEAWYNGSFKGSTT